MLRRRELHIHNPTPAGIYTVRMTSNKEQPTPEYNEGIPSRERSSPSSPDPCKLAHEDVIREESCDRSIQQFRNRFINQHIIVSELIGIEPSLTYSCETREIAGGMRKLAKDYEMFISRQGVDRYPEVPYTSYTELEDRYSELCEVDDLLREILPPQKRIISREERRSLFLREYTTFSDLLDLDPDLTNQSDSQEIAEGMRQLYKDFVWFLIEHLHETRYYKTHHSLLTREHFTLLEKLYADLSEVDDILCQILPPRKRKLSPRRCICINSQCPSCKARSIISLLMTKSPETFNFDLFFASM